MMSERADATENARAAVVALAGAPNVGKSTLLNRILGRPLSIATPKPQTTRTRVLGIYTRDVTQLVFTDTPGILVPRGLLHERMVESARASVRGADRTCWILAADRGVRSVDRTELPRLVGRPTTIVINKVDLVARASLLPLIAEVAELHPEAEVFPLSALSGENVDPFVAHLIASAPAGPWLYPPDMLSDQPERFFVAELIREQLYRQLSEELPYRVAVKVEQFEERKPKTFIAATIFVDHGSAKKIVVGSKGARIRAIGKAARRAIEDFLTTPVYLELFVRVRKDWQNDPRFLRELGL